MRAMTGFLCLRAAVAGLAWLIAIAAPGCGSAETDLTQRLEMTDVTTGWYDAGIVEGNKNKLVPTVSFKLRNRGADEVTTVQLNAVFRRKGEQEEWGSAFVWAIRSNGLSPGLSTQPIVLRSQLGYTGEQPRAEILSHSQFVDARVEVFGKQGSANYVKLGAYDIKRQLLTR